MTDHQFDLLMDWLRKRKELGFALSSSLFMVVAVNKNVAPIPMSSYDEYWVTWRILAVAMAAVGPLTMLGYAEAFVQWLGPPKRR